MEVFLTSLPLNLPPTWSLHSASLRSSYSLPLPFSPLSRSHLTYVLSIHLFLLLTSFSLSTFIRWNTKRQCRFFAALLHVPHSCWRRGWCKITSCDMVALITTGRGFKDGCLYKRIDMTLDCMCTSLLCFVDAAKSATNSYPNSCSSIKRSSSYSIHVSSLKALTSCLDQFDNAWTYKHTALDWKDLKEKKLIKHYYLKSVIQYLCTILFEEYCIVRTFIHKVLEIFSGVINHGWFTWRKTINKHKAWWTRNKQISTHM